MFRMHCLHRIVFRLRSLFGRHVKLNGLPFTVAGVMPPRFTGASWGAALSGFVPAAMLPELSQAHGRMIVNRGETGFFLMGRLQPGVTLAQARAAVGVAMARLVGDYPESFLPEM